VKATLTRYIHTLVRALLFLLLLFYILLLNRYKIINVVLIYSIIVFIYIYPYHSVPYGAIGHRIWEQWAVKTASYLNLEESQFPMLYSYSLTWRTNPVSRTSTWITKNNAWCVVPGRAVTRTSLKPWGISSPALSRINIAWFKYLFTSVLFSSSTLMRARSLMHWLPSHWPKFIWSVMKNIFKHFCLTFMKLHVINVMMRRWDSNIWTINYISKSNIHTMI